MLAINFSFRSLSLFNPTAPSAPSYLSFSPPYPLSPLSSSPSHLLSLSPLILSPPSHPFSLPPSLPSPLPHSPSPSLISSPLSPPSHLSPLLTLSSALPLYPPSHLSLSFLPLTSLPFSLSPLSFPPCLSHLRMCQCFYHFRGHAHWSEEVLISRLPRRCQDTDFSSCPPKPNPVTPHMPHTPVSTLVGPRDGAN